MSVWRSTWRRGRATYSIHQRLLAEATKRGPDAPFLCMDWPEYFGFASGLVAALKQQKAWTAEQAARLRGMGLKPESWAKAVEQYDARAGIVVARWEELVKAMDALGRCWFRGANYCRDFFT